jgi:hypothetical protein
MVCEFAYLESLEYFTVRHFAIYFVIQNFILMDLLALTGHDVKRRIANQFSFVSLQQNSPFDVMSGNFKS